MTITAKAMEVWVRKLLGAAPAETRRPLPEFLEAIPRLDSLANLPSGTPVLVRGDVDSRPGKEVGQGDIRLRSMRDTLLYGRRRGWKQIVFGHIGRDPEASLANVRQRLAAILQCPVAFFERWLDEPTLSINAKLIAGIEKSPPGTIILLENTRQYQIERALWKAKPEDAPALAEKLAKVANEFADKLARVYVNEALSAGSLDTSSTIIPAAMDRVALGAYVAQEFDGPMMRCLKASLVVFSGLKIDKLDDLSAIIDRGAVRCVIAAGSLAMALKKADAQLSGGNFSLGLAEDAAKKDEPYYIPTSRIEQAKAMLTAGRKRGVEFMLPVDFVLQDGRTGETIGPADQQLDVGPKTCQLFEARVGQFISDVKGDRSVAPVVFHNVVFYNGVFGKFEDPKFEEGTRRFIGQLKRMHDAGIEVYIGGGEGGTALEKYGQPDWVTHAFTAGGTVLNALGGEPVPYLLALKMAVEAKK
jgi:phosphoglycerate kinase